MFCSYKDSCLKTAVAIFGSFNDALNDLYFNLIGLIWQACGPFANEKDPARIIRPFC